MDPVPHCQMQPLKPRSLQVVVGSLAALVGAQLGHFPAHKDLRRILNISLFIYRTMCLP